MTDLQYERWKDFAYRMAKHGLTGTAGRRLPRKSIAKVVEMIDWFFDVALENNFGKAAIACIVDWDNSDNYSPGDSEFSRKYRCRCWHCSKATTGLAESKRLSDCPYGCEDGLIYDYSHPYCAGDMCTTMMEHFNPYYWSGESGDADYERWDELWGGRLRCCIRAGLDCASSPSAGVIGFTAGDIRRMYPEGVPEWLFPEGERLQHWLSDEVNGTFAELPDTAGVLL